MTETETRPAFTAPTEDDLLAKAAKTVDAYRMECRFCPTRLGVFVDVPQLVDSAKRLGWIAVDLPVIDFAGGPMVLCPKCKDKPLGSFRHKDHQD